MTTGIWMVSLSAYSSQDLVVARRAARLPARPPAEMLRWLLVLPWSIVLETGRRLGRRVHALVIQPLRTLHSGKIGDYIAWMMTGMATLAVFVGLPVL